MYMILFALTGFLAFLGYDLFSIHAPGGRIWKLLFPAGIALWGLATAGAVIDGLRSATPWRAWFFGGCALACLGLEIYVLFFALPLKETYVRAESARCVCDSGVYGLCRHPGFWSFAGIYLFLLAALPGRKMMLCAPLMVLLNFGYIFIQDRYTFMRTFRDYGEYRKRVPFLIPRRRK